MKDRVICPTLLFAVLLFAGCRSMYYSAWESVGKHKRELLKDRVEEAREGQVAAAQQFTNALTRLKDLYRFDGGELEKAYNSLKSDQDRFDTRAEVLRTRIAQMDRVAKDLFAEWDTEMRTISTPRLREDSARKLASTKARYEELHQAMQRAEQSMGPVVAQFRDYVLYLKHNLNAQAIGTLRGEALDIEKETRKLIDEMNSAIAKADSFVKELPE